MQTCPLVSIKPELNTISFYNFIIYNYYFLAATVFQPLFTVSVKATGAPAEKENIRADTKTKMIWWCLLDVFTENVFLKKSRK